MCCEITNKFMRTDTVYTLLKECMEEDRSEYRKNFQAKVVKSIILTGYNNKTYRIDDIDWKSTPTSSFQRKDGTSITYAQYFKEVRIKFP